LRKRDDSKPPGRSDIFHLDCLAASAIAGTTIEGPIPLTSEHDRTPSVQDDFLQTLVRDKTTVNVFLVSGIRLSGQLAAFDQFVVLLESGSGSQLVFKHAISTVLPVNGREPARDPSEVPVSGDRSNHVRGRVR
jgi:host factor-I protein